MPWIENAQKAKNVDITITCMDCNKLRCLMLLKRLQKMRKKF
jgi:hypothetical protein